MTFSFLLAEEPLALHRTKKRTVSHFVMQKGGREGGARRRSAVTPQTISTVSEGSAHSTPPIGIYPSLGGAAISATALHIHGTIHETRQTIELKHSARPRSTRKPKNKNKKQEQKRNIIKSKSKHSAWAEEQIEKLGREPKTSARGTAKRNHTRTTPRTTARPNHASSSASNSKSSTPR